MSDPVTKPCCPRCGQRLKLHDDPRRYVCRVHGTVAAGKVLWPDAARDSKNRYAPGRRNQTSWKPGESGNPRGRRDK